MLQQCKTDLGNILGKRGAMKVLGSGADPACYTARKLEASSQVLPYIQVSAEMGGLGS